MNEEQNTQTGGGFSSWSGGLFDALGTIGSAALGGGQPQTPQYIPAPTPPAKDNTMLFVIGGIVLTIVIVVVVVISKKKS